MPFRHVSRLRPEFQLNASFLKQSCGLSAEDWCRPNDHTNQSVLACGPPRVVAHHGAGAAGTRMDAAVDAACMRAGRSVSIRRKLRSPEVLMEAWDETCGRLDAALDSASEELLDTPAPQAGTAERGREAERSDQFYGAARNLSRGAGGIRAFISGACRRDGVKVCNSIVAQM